MCAHREKHSMFKFMNKNKIVDTDLKLQCADIYSFEYINNLSASAIYIIMDMIIVFLRM